MLVIKYCGNIYIIERDFGECCIPFSERAWMFAYQNPKTKATKEAAMQLSRCYVNTLYYGYSYPDKIVEKVMAATKKYDRDFKKS